MAAPIMHLLLAFNVLSLLPDYFNKQDFIIGTMFPDIRHAANLQREVTHIEPVSWNDVINCQSSFKAGMLFHNIVDIIRIYEIDTYPHLKHKDLNTTEKTIINLTYKFAEDTVAYNQLSKQHIKDIQMYFSKVCPEALTICQNEKIIKTWYKSIKKYCKRMPNLNRIHKFLSHSGKLNLKIFPYLNAEKLYIELINSNEFKQKITQFIKNFNKLLKHNTKLSTPQIAYF